MAPVSIFPRRREASIHLYIFFLTLAMLAGCQSPGSKATSANPPVVRRFDSAGIEQVHNAFLPDGDHPLTLRQVFKVGVVDGDEHLMFTRIVGVALTPSGQVVVANAGSGKILIFGPDGTFIRQFGRLGPGPAELASLNDMWLSGDTVVLSGVLDEKTLLVTTAGDFLQSAVTLQFDPRAPEVLGRGPNGWLGTADKRWRTTEQAMPDSVATSVVAFGSAVNTAPRTLYTLPPRSTRLHPYSARWMAGFDGAGRFYVSLGFPYRIEIRDSTGRLVRVITKAHPAIPVTSALTDGLVDKVGAALDSLARGRYPEPKRSMYTDLVNERLTRPTPANVPVTEDLLVSDDGWLWLRRVDGYPLRRAVMGGRLERQRAEPAGSAEGRSRPPDRWDIFQPDGAYAGYVVLPVNFEPHAVRGNRIAGYTIDDDEVEYPTVYEAGERR